MGQVLRFPRFDSYTDSGIDWLGEIPSHWNIVKNKVIFTERKDAGEDGLPILSVSLHNGVSKEEQTAEENVRAKVRIEDKTSYKRVKPGDVAFNMMRAWQGAIGVVATDGMVSPAYIVARPRASVNGRFIDYLYRTAIYIQQMDRYSKGITDFRKRLYWDEFKQLHTLLPTIVEQGRIADFLDKKTAQIDEAIAKKQRLIELLREQKVILINRAVTKGLNPDAPMRDSGVQWIGEIPEYWKVKPNRYVFRETNARSIKGKERHLSMSQKLGLVPAEELDGPTLQSESYDGAKLCFEGDLVLNRLKAHLAVFSIAPCNGLVSPDYSVFRLQDDRYDSVFFENLFKTQMYITEFNRRAKGIVVGFYRLYSDSFKEIFV